MTFTAADFRRVAWAFVFTFLVVFAGGLTGVLEDLATSCKAGACDWNAAGAALAALVAAAVAGAFSFIKNLLLADNSSIK